MRFRIITTALGLAAMVVTPAMATHNHPAKANSFKVLFVRAYNQCTSPTLTHNSPLAFPACTPVEASSATQFGPKGFGQAIGKVKLNTAKQATDVQLLSKFGDIRTGTPTGPGFGGTLTVSGTIRTTDHACTTPGSCTLIDIPFPVSVPCTAGKCSSKTSANVVVPGSVQPGKEANVEIQQLQVYNGANLFAS